jgi:hypothetical protein
MNQLLSHKDCGEALQKFLALIRDHMLVVEDPPTTKRASSSYIHAELNKIYKSITGASLDSPGPPRRDGGSRSTHGFRLEVRN